MALELDIERFVDFLGFKDDPYPYMAHADVFVLSSLWEGLPVSLIEALAWELLQYLQIVQVDLGKYYKMENTDL